MITILIPLEVPSQNVRERWHWAKQRREVKQWAAWFGYAMRPGDMDKAVGRRRVEIKAYRKVLIRDKANLVGGCKGLADGLVLAGLLVDDCDELAEFAYEQDLASRSPTKKPCTHIIITDIPPPAIIAKDPQI